MPVVIVPPPYQGPTQGVGRVVVAASTVRAAIDAVEEEFPGFAPLVFDEDGDLQRFVKIFRGGELVEGEALDAALDTNTEIEIVAAIAGG